VGPLAALHPGHLDPHGLALRVRHSLAEAQHLLPCLVGDREEVLHRLPTIPLCRVCSSCCRAPPTERRTSSTPPGASEPRSWWAPSTARPCRARWAIAPSRSP